jgi:hypothetical protein
VGWLARGQLSNPTDVAVYPQQVPATTIDDDHNQITAVTYTRADGLVVQALTAHLKSKLLTFPAMTLNIPASILATRLNAPALACTG